MVVDNEAKSLECIYHKFISVAGRIRNVFGSDMMTRAEVPAAPVVSDMPYSLVAMKSTCRNIVW